MLEFLICILIPGQQTQENQSRSITITARQVTFTKGEVSDCNLMIERCTLRQTFCQLICSLLYFYVLIVFPLPYFHIYTLKKCQTLLFKSMSSIIMK